MRQIYEDMIARRWSSSTAGGAVMTRDQVDPKDTWDTTKLFASDKAWEDTIEALDEAMNALSSFVGRLKEAPALLAFLTKQRELETTMEAVYAYAHLKNDEDTGNTTYQAFHMRAQRMYARYMAAIAFVEPEIVAWPEGTIDTVMAEEPRLAEWRHTLRCIVRKKPHTLSPREETMLASLSPVLDAGHNIFSVLTNADMTYPNVVDETGATIELTPSRYGRLLQSNDRTVRRQAFEALYKVVGQFQNSCAQTLSATVKAHNALKTFRGFKSAREAALFANVIPESVYDNLIASVEARLPLLHRYVAMRKAMLGVDTLHNYDLYVPLVENVDLTYSFDEACQLVLDALAPLGDDYVDIVRQGMKDRWIDRAENRGKRSGAYSSCAYGAPPYILLNWQGKLGDVFTLAHELGHSVHTYLAQTHQPQQYAGYSTFLAEIASTCNENLLVDHLLKTVKDDRVRRYILNDFIDGYIGTIFRQTQFAAFEQWVHEQDDKGVALTAEGLSEKYLALKAAYYGSALAKDPEIALEWARIPHFYYNFYVYQYATGFSAAAAFAARILKGEPGVVERYKDVLRAGSSDDPIQVLQKAGVDMTTPAVVDEALNGFAACLDRFEAMMV